MQIDCNGIQAISGGPSPTTAVACGGAVGALLRGDQNQDLTSNRIKLASNKEQTRRLEDINDEEANSADENSVDNEEEEANANDDTAAANNDDGNEEDNADDATADSNSAVQ